MRSAWSYTQPHAHPYAMHGQMYTNAEAAPNTGASALSIAN